EDPGMGRRARAEVTRDAKDIAVCLALDVRDSRTRQRVAVHPAALIVADALGQVAVLVVIASGDLAKAERVDGVESACAAATDEPGLRGPLGAADGAVTDRAASDRHTRVERRRRRGQGLSHRLSGQG